MINFLSAMLVVAKPTGIWENFIFAMEQHVGMYAATLIVVTLIIKVAMLPLDFFNRYTTKKNSRKMAIIQPQMIALQKRYGNNREMLSRKTMELYKKENYNILGTFLGMITNLVLTLVVFITLFGALNKISYYKMYEEYTVLKTEFYIEVYGSSNPTEEQLAAELSDEQIKAGQAKVAAKYKTTKSGFLWIDNIWRPDNWSSVVPNYETFIKNAKLTETDITKQEYNMIMGQVAEEYGNWNGYLILTILAAATTYLSIKIPGWVGAWRAKKKNKQYSDPMAKNKVMFIIMPIIMGIFTLFYNAAFGLYIVAGSLFSVTTSPFIALAVDAIDEKQIKKEEEKNKVSYSRK